MTFFKDLKNKWFNKEGSIVQEAKRFNNHGMAENISGSGQNYYKKFGYSGIHVSKDPERRAQQLLKIKRMCEKIAKYHGAPRPLVVDVATGQDMYGAASTIGKQNQIIIGKKVMDEAHPDEIMNIYSGIAVHEAEHLISSSGMFKWINTNLTKMNNGDHELTEQKDRLNVVEDVRIEALASERSPGYTGYLQATRDHVFGNKWREKLLNDWDEMTIRSKAFAVIFNALRCPENLTTDMKLFAREGVCPYTYMDSITTNLRSWSHVKHVESRIKDLLDFFVDEQTPDQKKKMDKLKSKMKKKFEEILKNAKEDGYEPQPQNDLDESGGESIDVPFEKDEKEKAKEEQQVERAAAEIDADIKQYLEAVASTLETLVKNKQFDKAKEFEKEQEKKEGAKLRNKQKQSKELRDSVGFGYSDVQQANTSEIGEDDVMKTDTREKLETLIDEKFQMHDVWKENSDKVITVEPVFDPKLQGRWESLKKNSDPYVKRLRNKFLMRMGEKTVTQTDRKEGRIHQRKLAHARTTDRVMYTKRKTRAVGISVCILLDESGSMGYVNNNFDDPNYLGKASMCVQAGYVLQQALIGIPRVDFHMYSHTSYGGWESEDTYIKRLYGPNRKDPKNILGYGHGHCMEANYDHRAIEFVGNEFRKNAKYKKTLMIVIADGQPCGTFKGESAIPATKKVVDNQIRLGTNMMMIAIDSMDPSSMFKNYVVFDDISNMINDLGKVIQSSVINSGREVH